MQEQTATKLTAEEILAGLNQALLAEEQAVADYDAHAQACDQPQVAAALETLRDVEAEHAMRLASRITALGGTPSSQAISPRPIVNGLAVWLDADLQAEQWAIVEYARLVAGILDDDQTAGLMAELLEDEIRHAAWLKARLRELAS
jgi:bacterioferritin (cytochrome b1)